MVTIETHYPHEVVLGDAEAIALIQLLMHARTPSGARIEFTVSGIDEIDVAAEAAKQAVAA